MNQNNSGNAKSWQTKVEGGTNYIGENHIYQSSAPSKTIPSYVPKSSTNFVGRETKLEQIHAQLQNGQGVIVCAVEGMGGVGKSELVFQYAQRYRQEYAAQYWLQLREMDLARAVVTLASRTFPLPETMQSASLEEQAAWYWANWLPQEGKVLVILDDVTDLKSIPKQARPLDPRFQVLVTTRKRKLSSQFADIPLGVISEAEALELLSKLVGKSRVDKELIAAKSICEYLGYLPLGMELAGRYLQQDEDLRLSDYRQRLTIADESLDLQESEEINATRGIIAAFELSWQELSVSSRKVAMLLGLFAPADITWSLVEEIAAQLNIDEGDLREARKQLNNWYLIKAIDEDRTRFTVHSLTRQFLQWKLAQEPDTNRLFRESFVMSLIDLAKKIPEVPTQDLIAKVAPVIPHLDMMSREMLDDILNPKEDLIWTFVGTARFYQGQGLYGIAEEPFQNCLKVIEKRLGANHPATSTSLNNLASLYEVQGNYSKAEPLFIRSIEIDERIYGKEHIEVAVDCNNLANLYKLQGRYVEAELFFVRFIEIIEKYPSATPSDIASGLNNLSSLYQLQGKYTQAEPLAVRALEITEKQLGSEDPYTAFSLNTLAEIYRLQGD